MYEFVRRVRPPRGAWRARGMSASDSGQVNRALVQTSGTPFHDAVHESSRRHLRSSGGVYGCLCSAATRRPAQSAARWCQAQRRGAISVLRGAAAEAHVGLRRCRAGCSECCTSAGATRRLEAGGWSAPRASSVSPVPGLAQQAECLGGEADADFLAPGKGDGVGFDAVSECHELVGFGGDGKRLAGGQVAFGEDGAGGG